MMINKNKVLYLQRQTKKITNYENEYNNFLS